MFFRALAFFVVGLAAAACGSKSGLFESGASTAASGGAGSGGAGAGGSSSGGAGNTGGHVDAGPDAPPPLPDCTYVLHGEPIVLFTYGDGVRSPMLARLSAGSPGVAARIAFGLIHEHFWHPDIRVADVAVGPAWPDGVSVTHPMTLYGIDAHSGGISVSPFWMASARVMVRRLAGDQSSVQPSASAIRSSREGM